MGYTYLYLFIFLVLFMFLLKLFIPFLVYLLPVFLVLYLIKIIFKNRKQKEQTYEEASYQSNQSYSSNPDIIDVDYTVIDEEEHDAQ